MSIKDQFKSRPGLNSAVGIALAVIAGLLLLGYLSQIVRGREGGPPIEVPVATRDIEIGTVIDGDMVQAREIPEKYVVPGSLKSRKAVTGARSARFIGKGEPFTSASIQVSSSGGPLASRIPPDMRAYTLQLGPRSGARSDLGPGDRVDVLATTGDPPVTSTILSDRLILSAGGNDRDGSESRMETVDLTLLLSPGEAEVLTQAEYAGEISISLCPLPQKEADAR